MEKRVYRRIAAVILIICLICSSGISAAAAEATASVVRLAKTEGEVSVSSQSGKSVPLVSSMKLYNGYRTATMEESYAWITLDSWKTAKLDAVSEMEVRQRGKKLELLLTSGNLYFNVSSPLNDDETFNIRTSTMVTGIRGTAGWVKIIDEGHTQVYILEGTVFSSVTDPVTGQTKYITLKAGQMADFYVYDKNKDGDKCDIILQYFGEDDVDGFAAVEIMGDEELKNRITAGNTGLDLGKIAQTAEDRLKKDKEEVKQKLQGIEEQIKKQENQILIDPVFQDEYSSDGSGHSSSGSGSGSENGSEDGSSGGNGGGSGSEDGSSGETEESQEGSETTEDPEDPSLPEEPESDTVELTMKVTAAEINEYLKTKNVVLNAGPGDDVYNTLDVDVNLSVPEGRSLTMKSGVHMDVETGMLLQIDGTVSMEGNMVNKGTINNTSMNTFQVGGSFVNTGDIRNTGRLISASLQNDGNLSNEGIIEGTVTNSGSLEAAGGQWGTVFQSADTAKTILTAGELPQSFEITGGTLEIAGGTAENKIQYGGDTFILSSGSLRQGIEVTKGEIIINGGSVSGGITLTDGILVVNSGVINGGVLENGGEITLAGGTVNGGMIFRQGIAAVNGGTVNGSGGTVLSIPAGSTAEVQINGGTIDGQEGKIISVLSDGASVSIDAESAVLKAENPDGAIETGENASWILKTKEGSSLTIYPGNVFGFQEEGSILRLTSAYETIRSALSQAEGGTRITLEEDYTDEGTESIAVINGSEDLPVILDLNGHSLLLKNSLTVGDPDSPDTGALTIKDSSKKGSLQAEFPEDNVEYAIVNAGKLKIEGVTFSCRNNRLISNFGNSADLKISEGTLEYEFPAVEADPFSMILAEGKVSITGSIVKAGDSLYIIEVLDCGDITIDRSDITVGEESRILQLDKTIGSHINIVSSEMNVKESGYGIFVSGADDNEIQIEDSKIISQGEDGVDAAIYFGDRSYDNFLTIKGDSSVTAEGRPALKMEDSVITANIKDGILVSKSDEGTFSIYNSREGYHSPLSFEGGEVINEGEGPGLNISDANDRNVYIPEDPRDMKTVIKSKGENPLTVNGQTYEGEGYETVYNEDDGYWYFQASPQSVQARALLEESALATPSEAEEEIIDEEILDEDELYDHWGLATPSEAEDATPSEGNYDQEEEEGEEQ